MNKTLYNTWMTITSLVSGIMGLAFILASIFDESATKSVLIIGLLFVAAGSLFNGIRLRRNKKNRGND